MSYDAELLRRYAEEKSEAAFAEFVQRNAGLVHASALRRLGGNTHAASDVVQKVFVSVARNVRKLMRCEHLSSWLFAATRNAALNHMRDEIRRKQREQKAHADNAILAENAVELNWEKLRPVLDETLDGLREADREAVLLRFMENRPFAEIGERLCLSENAARMRVDRALGQLRNRLARRGIQSTAAGLAMAVSSYASTPAPAAVIHGATNAALAAGTPAGVTALGLALLNAKVVVFGIVAAGMVAVGVYTGRISPKDVVVIPERSAGAQSERTPPTSQVGSQAPSLRTVSSAPPAATRRDQKPVADPKAAKIAYERALKLEQSKEYEAAIALYSFAIGHDPKLFEAYFARARIYQTLLPLVKRDYVKAREDYTRCLEIDPTDYATRYNRALCLEALHDYPAAIADYTAIIEGEINFSRWTGSQVGQGGKDEAVALAQAARARLLQH